MREFLEIEGLLHEEEAIYDHSTIRAQVWNAFEHPGKILTY